MRRDSAFTLVELLAVLAVIAVLVAVLLPSLQRARDVAKLTICVANKRSVAAADALYSADNLAWFTPFHMVNPLGATQGGTATAGPPSTQAYLPLIHLLEEYSQTAHTKIYGPASVIPSRRTIWDCPATTGISMAITGNHRLDTTMNWSLHGRWGENGWDEATGDGGPYTNYRPFAGSNPTAIATSKDKYSIRKTDRLSRSPNEVPNFCDAWRTSSGAFGFGAPIATYNHLALNVSPALAYYDASTGNPVAFVDGHAAVTRYPFTNDTSDSIWYY